MSRKFCKFAKLHRMTTGRKKVQCKLDGSIHNQCSERCPHLRLTFQAKVRVWMWRRRNLIKEARKIWK